MNPTQANHLARTGLALAAMLLVAGLFVYGAGKVLEAVGKGLGELATRVLEPVAGALTAQNAFLTALYAADLKAAYALTSDLFQAEVTLDEFTVFVIHHAEFAEFRDLAVESVAADGCVFRVEGEDRGKPVTCRLSLGKHGEVWRVDAMSWE